VKKFLPLLGIEPQILGRPDSKLRIRAIYNFRIMSERKYCRKPKLRELKGKNEL
jgi:hypothetical protein